MVRLILKNSKHFQIGIKFNSINLIERCALNVPHQLLTARTFNFFRTFSYHTSHGKCYIENKKQHGGIGREEYSESLERRTNDCTSCLNDKKLKIIEIFLYFVDDGANKK